MATPRTEEPPLSLKLNRLGTKVVLRVPLRNIPPQFINFQPSPTRLHLDTLKYSKKYLVDREWPQSVTVVADDSSEASLDKGMLTAVFDVVQTSEAAAKAQAELKRRAEAALAGKRKKAEAAEAAPPKKKSRPGKLERQAASEGKSSSSSLALAEEVAGAVETKIKDKLKQERQSAKEAQIAEANEQREQRKSDKIRKKNDVRTKIKAVVKELKQQKQADADPPPVPTPSASKKRVSFSPETAKAAGSKKGPKAKAGKAKARK